ncbi:MAG: GxxExxY protein [SAR324 cluster bacterium]
MTAKPVKSTEQKALAFEKIIFRQESYAIQGAIFAVYREMGSGFLESVYQECMERELTTRGIPFEAQKELQLLYKGKALRERFKPDLICHGKIIVELKAVKALAPEYAAQVLNYLKSAGLTLGLLVNFGSHPKVTIKRLAR